MNVLVIGSGGREHAICHAFSKSTIVQHVYVAPGNDGMRDVATCVPIDALDFEKLIQFAKENAIDCVFVGPEQPLADGIVDWFRKEGIFIFGPTKAAAQLEGSKAFAKDFMKKHDIPTARYETFTNKEAAVSYIREVGVPIVVKADGLAAGKGVVVAFQLDEAVDSVESFLSNGHAQVVVEEFLEGEEFSLLSLVSGDVVLPLEIAQDHKRAFDGDKGPNTGGMGAYSPVPHISSIVVERAIETIVRSTVAAMKADGNPFSGVLYTGLILTSDGPKVIEYNVRFGDPETQVILPRLQTDFGEVMRALENEQPIELHWSDQSVVGVVVAAEGYPASPKKGEKLPDLDTVPGTVSVYHAGTKQSDQGFVGNSGRVLLVCAEGETLEKAADHVYEWLNRFEWNGFFYRKDIGHRGLRK